MFKKAFEDFDRVLSVASRSPKAGDAATRQRQHSEAQEQQQLGGPQSRQELSELGDSLLADLPQGYFELDFDPLQAELSQLPSAGVSEGLLEQLVEGRTQALEVIFHLCPKGWSGRAYIWVGRRVAVLVHAHTYTPSFLFESAASQHARNLLVRDTPHRTVH